MTLTAEKLPFSGDFIEKFADRILAIPSVAAIPFVHRTCQSETNGYVCGRKAVNTCTVCEVTQCDRCDCGCER